MKWIKTEDQPPPLGVELIVYKHYMNQKFCPKHGGYTGPQFASESRICIDISYKEFVWSNGGIVTHWMERPKEPKDKKR